MRTRQRGQELDVNDLQHDPGEHYIIIALRRTSVDHPLSSHASRHAIFASTVLRFNRRRKARLYQVSTPISLPSFTFQDLELILI
jgi:hypothetical protein